MNFALESKQSKHSGSIDKPGGRKPSMRCSPFIFRLIKLAGTACLFTAIFFLCHARSQEVIDIGRFSAVKSGEILSPGWKPLLFRNINE